MRVAFSILGSVALVLATGCPTSMNDVCSYPNTCLNEDGGAADGDAKIDAPPGCDLAKDPKDSPACIDDAVGVFVDSAKGVDTNAGTKAAPVKTISGALAKAGAKPRVYVCKGTYAETVTVTTATSLYGGFSCDAWAYAAENVVRIVGDKDGPALTVKGASSGISVSDVEVLGKEGAAGGGTSVGAFVSASTVRFVRTKLEAQAGGLAKEGTLVSYSYPASVNGGDAPDMTNGGAQGKVSCPGGKSGDGAKGGNIGFSGDTGTPAGLGGAGGVLGQPCAGTGGGGEGKPGTTPSSGAGATKLGRLDASGWIGEPGQNGEAGGPGGGGGGGAGNGGAGGGGGSGGCGGAGATAGGAGGSSIALLSLDSEVTLVRATLLAAEAKKGGGGAAGQAGQTTFGFGGGKTAGACIGGNGGPGGNGGGGGGGAGGVSAGIVWTGGKEPTRDQDSKITHATGAVAPGGDGDNKGKDGVNADVVPL